MGNIMILYWMLVYFPIIAYSVQFISTPSSEITRTGQTIIFFCQINMPIKNCVWTKVNSFGKTSITATSHEDYQFVGNFSEGTCHLKLLHANPELDVGNWTCHLTTVNNQEVISDEAHLIFTHTEHAEKAEIVNLKPGVFIGSFCAAGFFLGGLLTIFLLKRKQQCLLAPPGHSSRSMLITTPNEQETFRTSGCDNLGDGQM